MPEAGKWMDEGEGGIKDGDAWGQTSAPPLEQVWENDP